MWEKLLAPVTDIIKKVLDKVAGDKMSEGDKALLALEAQKLAIAELQGAEQSFRDFVLDYEGAAKDMPRSIQILRGSVRPIITYFLAGAWVWGFHRIFMGTFTPEQLPTLREILSLLTYLNMVSLVFWFGDRFIQSSGISQRIINGPAGANQQAP